MRPCRAGRCRRSIAKLDATQKLIYVSSSDLAGLDRPDELERVLIKKLNDCLFSQRIWLDAELTCCLT